jgi:hypothetical protein
MLLYWLYRPRGDKTMNRYLAHLKMAQKKMEIEDLDWEHNYEVKAFAHDYTEALFYKLVGHSDFYKLSDALIDLYKRHVYESGESMDHSLLARFSDDQAVIRGEKS